VILQKNEFHPVAIKLKAGFSVTLDCLGKKHIHHFFEITFKTSLETNRFCLLGMLLL
jgi:hypothetical protein